MTRMRVIEVVHAVTGERVTRYEPESALPEDAAGQRRALLLLVDLGVTTPDQARAAMPRPRLVP